MLCIDDEQKTDWVSLQKELDPNVILKGCKFNYSTKNILGDEVSICVDNLKTANLNNQNGFEAADFVGIKARILNESGIEIDNTADIDKQACAEFNLYNKNDFSHCGQIILALYKGNKLCMLKKDDVCLEAYSKKNCKIEVMRDELESDFGEYTIKGFLWEENMKPVLLTEIAENKENYPLQLYVGKTGGESNSEVFDDIHAVNEYIKELKKNGNYPEHGIDVNIREGIYTLKDGIDLSEDISGTENAPVTYRAYKGEKVVFAGGVRLRKEGFCRTSEKIKKELPQGSAEHVYEYDLKKDGFTSESLGELGYIGAAAFNHLPKYYSGITTSVGSTLYVNNEKMHLAQWSNEGYADIQEVIDSGDITKNWSDDKKGTSEYISPEERPETPRGLNHSQVSRHKKVQYFRGAGYLV